ncbi:hypothetical protein LTR53_011160 [Teratosphaeriaceae sp. CCFEE 6253]|nr:hypothetical protein LTR53_011160 [Teratosphaeriaceae sp. CCFEE 6253]
MTRSLTTSILSISLLTYYTALAQNDTCDPNPCVSYGIDIQGGGTYFENISSTDPFSFVSVFEGCDPDTVNNILVDPDGDEYQCSNTNLTPDDANQQSSCPIRKHQLESGDWSILLISNNGAGCPIAYERDFSLSVGVPTTETVTPTVTLSATSTPIQNVTTTQTSTSTITVTSVVTSPLKTIIPTTTSTPVRITTTRIITQGTVSKTKYIAIPTLFTKTAFQICSIPPRQPWADPWCTITPTLVSAAALSTNSVAAHAARRRGIVHRVPSDREVRIAERKARLARARVDRRDTTASTTTVTETNHGCHQLDVGHDDPNAYNDCHDDILKTIKNYFTGASDHHSSDPYEDADEVHSPHDDRGNGY